MAGSRGVAEDVVQEAFLNIWRSGARYERARGSVRTWVLGHRPPPRDRRAAPLVRARAAGARATRGSRSGWRPASGPTSRPRATRRPRHGARRARASCPSEQSQVIELAYFGGFTHTEIATMLETPVGTVKGRMRLGLEKMRHALGRRAGEPRMTTPGPRSRALGRRRRLVPARRAAAPTSATASRRTSSDCPVCRARGRASCASPPTRCRVSVPPVAPPAGAQGPDHGRRRVRGRAARRRRPAGRRAAARAAPARARRGFLGVGWLLRPGVALACAAVLLVAGGVAGVLLAGGDDEHAHRRRRHERAAAPTSSWRSATTARRSSRATCPRRRPGRIYQVWTQAAGARARADVGAVVAAQRRLGRGRGARLARRRRGRARHRRAARRLRRRRRRCPVITAPTA